MSFERVVIQDEDSHEGAGVENERLKVDALVQSGDSPSIDAFGRDRVSGTGQRLDAEFIYDNQPTLFDAVSGGAGTVTHDTSSRDLVLATNGAALADAQAIYSHYDVPYTAGNSQLIDITGTINNAALSGGAVEIFLRSSVTGAPVEQTWAQANWSEDPVLDVEWDKSQIFQVDFQSLKVGRLRFNLVRSGETVNVHEIVNDNIRATGYWQTPTLPIMYRIYNDALNTYAEIGYGDADNAVGWRFTVPLNAAAELRAICATVKSEGGFNLFDIPGFSRAIDMGVTTKTVSTTLIPLISLQVATTFNALANRGLYVPNGWSVQTTNPIRVAVLYRPTLTGPAWAAVDAVNSGLNYDVTASAVSGGILVDVDYVTSAARNFVGGGEGLLGRTIMSLGRTGTADILTLAAIRTDTNDADVLGGFKWKEVR